METQKIPNSQNNFKNKAGRITPPTSDYTTKRQSSNQYGTVPPLWSSG